MYHFQVQKMTHTIMNDIVYIDHMKIADVPASPCCLVLSCLVLIVLPSYIGPPHKFE